MGDTAGCHRRSGEKQKRMDYVAEWEYEEEDELVIEKAELER